MIFSVRQRFGPKFLNSMFFNEEILHHILFTKLLMFVQIKHKASYEPLPNKLEGRDMTELQLNQMKTNFFEF